MPTKDIHLIIGPTAIGKSDYAIKKYMETGAEIISADAFQVYKYMDIGTAKVSKEIRTKIPHHLIDIKTPDQDYSVAEFLERTSNLIKELRKKQVPIIICGGTGFYINAFLYNFKFKAAKSNQALRQQLTEEADRIGGQEMWDKLNAIDPSAANIINPNNVRRVIRAMEIYHLNKALPSEIREKNKQPRKDIILTGLTTERALIYQRINSRVDVMIKQGLIEEVKGLLAKGYNENSQAFEALGYKETIQYLKGSLTKEEMVELIKAKTRQFAKRQLTWFRRFENVQWISSS